MQVRFASANSQSKVVSVVLNGVLGPPCPVHHTGQCCCFSAVSEATFKVRFKALEGTVSVQGSETESDERDGGTDARKKCFSQ